MPLRFVPRTNTPAALPGFGYQLRTVALYSYGITDNALSPSTPVVAGTASGPFSTATYNATVDADANFLVVLVCTPSVTSASGVTFDGVATYRLGTVFANAIRVEMWGLANPHTGTLSVVVSGMSSGQFTNGAWAFKNVGASPGTDSGVGSTFSGSAGPVTTNAITGAANGLLMGGTASSGGDLTAVGGTEGYTDNIGETAATFTADGTAQTQSWTLGSGTPNVSIMTVALQPASVPFDSVGITHAPTVSDNAIVTFSDALQKLVLKKISDTALALTETLVTTRQRNLADTALSFSDAVVTTRVRTIADTALSFSDAVATTRQRTLADTGLSFSDSPATTRVRSVSDTALSFSDSPARIAVRSVADTALSVSDTVQKVVVKNISDTALAVSDTISTKRQHAVTDTALGFSDAVATIRVRSVSDTALSLTDAAATTRQRQVTDTSLNFSDSVSRLAVRSITDSALTFTDSLSTLRVRNLTDTALGFSDTVAPLDVHTRTVADTALGFTDTLTTLRLRQVVDAGLSPAPPVTAGTASGPFGTVSYTATVDADANFLMVMIGTDSATTASGVTFDGVSMYRLGTVIANGLRAETWGLANPHAGALSVVITGMTGGFVNGAWAFKNVGTAPTADGGVGSLFSGSGGPFVTNPITGVANGILVGWTINSGGNLTATGGTVGFSDNIGETAARFAADGTAQTQTWTLTGGGTPNVSIMTVSLAPNAQFDTVALRPTTNVADTALSFSDTLATNRVRVVSDTAASFSDSVARSKSSTQTTTDTALSFSDTILRTSTRSRSPSDTVLSFSDTISRNATRTRSVTETFTFSDAPLSTRQRSIADTFSFSDSISNAAHTTRNITQTALTFSDSVVATKLSTIVFAPPVLAQLI